jgi:hypothetical protein
MEQIQATLDEVRNVVLELQRLIVTGTGEAGLWVRSCTSCQQDSCNKASASIEDPQAAG